ncbi:MAG: hypothetical protein ACRCZ0_04740 [Cetobacterium sp.]
MNYKNITLEKLSMDIDAIVATKLEEQRIKFDEEAMKKDKHIASLKNKLDDSLIIKRDVSGKYMNLCDFCRVTKSLLAIDLNGIKQYLHMNKVLVRNGEKYVPSNSSIATLVDGELYVAETYIRQLLLIRSFTAIGNCETITRMLDKFECKKEVIMEGLSNTVFVEYKQNSYEFRNLESSMYDLLNK